MESSPWREGGAEGVKYIVRLGEAILRESNFAETYIYMRVRYIIRYVRVIRSSVEEANY